MLHAPPTRHDDPERASRSGRNRVVSGLKPWVIDQLENEERLRREEDARRGHRIELPQTGTAEHKEPTGRRERSGASSVVEILPLSPGSVVAAVTVVDV